MKAARRLSWVSATATLALVGILITPTSGQGAAAATAAGDASLVPLTAEAPPMVPQGAVQVGALAPSTPLHVDVTLKVRDQTALTTFLAGLSDRNSPLFHRFLPPGQFGPRFGPTVATLAAVSAALRQAGLDPGPATSNRLVIPVDAPASAIEDAFDLQLEAFRLPGGRIAYANTGSPAVAANVAPYVSGVIGLDDLYPEQSLQAGGTPPDQPAPASSDGPEPAGTAGTSAPQPCSAASSTAKDDDAYTANQLASYYGMSPLYTLHDLGAGVRVALFELTPNLTSDIAAYKSCYGLSTTVSYHQVDGGAGSGAGSGEATLDIEDVLGLAPKAAIDVYQAPNNTTGALDIWNAIVTADQDQVISTSWGQCELLTSSSYASSEQTDFEQAAAQGESVLAAAGDTGSTGCLRTGVDESDLSAGDPSSQPYVVGVGGTSIPNIASPTESVWNDSGLEEGAGGGGDSRLWCMPAYQYQTEIPGLLSAASATNSACPSAEGSYVREDPDVSADADPETGYVIYFDGSWTAIGGTSAAAPLWAAAGALIDASPFCTDYDSGDPGVNSQGLWTVAADEHSYIYGTQPEIFKDVTSGNNDYTPSGYTGGLYPATAGYDMASGLGSPLLSGLTAAGKASMYYPGLAAMMCALYATKSTSSTVTSISPTSGPSSGGTTITIDGSGFLPIPGADHAAVGAARLTATCTTTTTCTIKTPKHTAGTVKIKMDVEDFGLSNGKTFTYQS
jgi:subtilase family serine protease